MGTFSSVGRAPDSYSGCPGFESLKVYQSLMVRLSRIIVGVDDGEGPPVPIPNTAVKLARADNTWLVTARKDR